jgi:redox-sensitive bicupin YhaK (pirin superfamily)
MNAGMGVIHSERPPLDIHEIGGRQEIIQLWINTPASHKMDQPAYFPLASENVPGKEQDGVLLKVFSGEVGGVKGPIPSHTEVNAATLELKKGSKFSVNLPADHNVVIYLLDGKLNIDGYGLAEGLNAVLFKKDGDGIAFEALEDTRVLLLTGKPLDEKVVSHGPFVMNNQTQILEAMRDYQMGKMGVLIE